MQLCTQFYCMPPPQHPPSPPPSPLHPLPPSFAPFTPSLLQPHMSRSIQRVAHHRHWWPSSLGPACLCHFLCAGLLVHVTLCSRGGHACCFTSCLAARDGQRGTAELSDSPPECYDSQLSCQSAPCCKWIWRRQFLWRSSQSVSMRLDDCFYCP